MCNIAIVYWSGTGNTQAMAEAVASGVQESGASADLIPAAAFSAAKMTDYDAIAFGCPSMGAEQLEESEFEPMFTACQPHLHGKKIALFGSYGWGDGEWMRNWEQSCLNDGAVLCCESVLCNEEPDDASIAACKRMGAALAE